MIKPVKVSRGDSLAKAASKEAFARAVNHAPFDDYSGFKLLKLSWLWAFERELHRTREEVPATALGLASPGVFRYFVPRALPTLGGAACAVHQHLPERRPLDWPVDCVLLLPVGQPGGTGDGDGWIEVSFHPDLVQEQRLVGRDGSRILRTHTPGARRTRFIRHDELGRD